MSKNKIREEKQLSGQLVQKWEEEKYKAKALLLVGTKRDLFL